MADSTKKEFRIFDSMYEKTEDIVYPLLKENTDHRNLRKWTYKPLADQKHYLFRQPDGHSCGVRLHEL